MEDQVAADDLGIADVLGEPPNSTSWARDLHKWVTAR
jgi:hypothetical protein